MSKKESEEKKMKKISLILLCGVILLGVCGCDSKEEIVKDNNGNKISTNDLLGTWQLQSEEKEVILEDGTTWEINDKIQISEIVKIGTCGGSGCPENAHFYSTENKQIQLYDNNFCFELENKDTLKQVSCEPFFEVYYQMASVGITKEYNLIYKKISKEKNENNKDTNTNNQDVKQKKISCDLTEEGTYYTGKTQTITTFENDTIVYHTMKIEKSFKDGYKAENDDWTKANMEAINNNTKKGISGNVYIKNNITYLTANYDVKENNSLIDLITSHTEYNDFLDNMRSNGYVCNTD